MIGGCHEIFLELKMEGQSCLAKVNYYHSIKGNRFIFMEECKVEIGDTFLLELIDEKKYCVEVLIVE